MAIPGATAVGAPAARPPRTAPATAVAARSTPARRLGVDLGGDHDHRPGQVPAEGLGVLGDVRRVDGAAQQQVAQEVALVLVLDGGDRLLAGDQQRGDRRGPLEGVHVVVADRLVGAHATRRARSTPPAATRDTCADAAVDPLDPHPAGGVDQVLVGEQRPVVVAERRGPLPAVGRGEHHARRRAPARPRRRCRRGCRPRGRSGSAPCAGRRPAPAPRWRAPPGHRLINTCTPLPSALAQPHIGKP